jgi:hypothetical protein
MPESYPYTISNNKIEPIFARVRSAAKPERFGRETLNTWGFTASNDRAMVAVMKELGFLTDSGVPTEHYDRLRDPNDWKYVLGERVKALYADLFAIDAVIQNAPEAEIKGAISRITGKDDETVKRYYATFKTLASLAKFEPRPVKQSREEHAPSEGEPATKKVVADLLEHHPDRKRSVGYHYNIQIHLPVTTDISVYNAIFKSLRENLDI